MTRFDLGLGAKTLSDIVTSVDDGDLRKPSPCPLFTVGDVIAHVGGFAQAFTAAARKERSPLVESPPTGDPAPLPADWRARIPDDLEGLAAAWRDPEAWVGITRIAGMDAPAEMVALTVADEIVVHGWDIARSLGRDYDADPDLVAAAQDFLSAFTSPDAPAGDDVPFGPSRLAPDGATRLEEVVALAGRDPSWTPPRT
ncbi:MAG: TIGR03086 family metal-binding protein [Actinomycetes bacterium]